jgi:hypothetical protein
MDATPVRIDEGSCLALFVYDVGHGIDLANASARLTAAPERARLQHQHPSPAYVQFRVAPVRAEQRDAELDLAGRRTVARVSVTLYEFGAISVGYRFPLERPAIADLLPLAIALYENPALLADSRARVQALATAIGDAIVRPGLADLVEDYVLYHAERWTPALPPSVVIEAERAMLARVLSAEAGELRASEVEDVLGCRLGYGPTDESVIGWNSAFLFDPEGDDALAVLEFATVELLEMRFLDDRLDAALDQSYETLRQHGRRGGWMRALRSPAHQVRRIALLQMDSAILFEGVNNAIKLLGDQYLARLYRLASRRFHLPDWDASILRKLQTLESIYQKLTDARDARRMELLEWIIILLIAVSILIPFVAGAGG